MLAPCMVFALTATGVLCQAGQPITTCCDGYQGPGAARNGTCRQVTYNVQQMYQACPPKGTVIEVDKPDSSPSTNSRLSTMEGKISQLENLYKDMVSRMSTAAPSGDRPEVPREKIHNVTNAGGVFPVDCTELFSLGYRCTGVYLIKPAGASQPFPAFCEMAYDGWTIIMRRFDGSVDFYRKWADYKLGFGSTAAEHWLGNDRIHLLTNQKNYQLRVETTYWSTGYTYFTDYQRFKIESEANKYKLHVTGYSGISGYDGLTAHNNRFFSTWDRDHDTWPNHCAQTFKGAWWYENCHASQLTGLYASPCVKNSCMEWNRQPMKAAIMKVKSIDK